MIHSLSLVIEVCPCSLCTCGCCCF